MTVVPLSLLITPRPLPKGRVLRHWFFNGGKPMVFPDDVGVEITDPDINGGEPFRYPEKGDVGVQDVNECEIEYFKMNPEDGRQYYYYSTTPIGFSAKGEDVLKLSFEDFPEYVYDLGQSHERGLEETTRFLAFIRHIVKEMGEAYTITHLMGETPGCTPDLKIVETCVDDVFSLIEGRESFKFERGTLYKFVRNTAAL